MVLIRPRAWWYNKIPLSVLTVLLLVEGNHFTPQVLLALVGLVAAVSGVANYGYAVNELYDIDEDRLGGRANAAAGMGSWRMWAIVALSGVSALSLSALIGGSASLLLTAGVLLLPLAYSIPPLRTKNRGWLGVLCDAAAAHLYPVLLAMTIVSRLDLRRTAPALVLSGALWALLTGVRGILSHQLQSEEHDRAAGLMTVVHRFGHARLTGVVIWTVLPLELLAFATFVSQAGISVLLVGAALAMLAYELVKYALDAVPVIVFSRRHEHYIPFVDEGAYKVWAPLALALDAAGTDLLYLTLVPIYVVLFRPRIAHEWNQMRFTGRMAWKRIGQASTRSGPLTPPGQGGL